MNYECLRYFLLILSIFGNVYKLDYLNFWTKNDKTGHSALVVVLSWSILFSLRLLFAEPGLRTYIYARFSIHNEVKFFFKSHTYGFTNYLLKFD